MAIPSLITPAHFCTASPQPSSPPESWQMCALCCLCVYTTVCGDRQVLSRLPATSLTKALFFDNTQKMTGFHHPASFYQISVWNTSKKVACVHLSVRIKRDWDSYHPCKSRRKVLAQNGSYTRWVDLQLQVKNFESWI